jgi:hypothetical protein
MRLCTTVGPQGLRLGESVPTRHMQIMRDAFTLFHTLETHSMTALKLLKAPDKATVPCSLP